jgi:hypothetical protein
MKTIHYSELGIRILEISYFTDSRQTRGGKKIPKTDLKTRLKTKEATYTLVLSEVTP